MRLMYLFLPYVPGSRTWFDSLYGTRYLGINIIPYRTRYGRLNRGGEGKFLWESQISERHTFFCGLKVEEEGARRKQLLIGGEGGGGSAREELFYYYLLRCIFFIIVLLLPGIYYYVLVSSKYEECMHLLYIKNCTKLILLLYIYLEKKKQTAMPKQ